MPMEADHNVVYILYERNGRVFGCENITIDIKNTSFGALRLLQKDLETFAEKSRKENNECWHPVTSAYADLLEKLSAELKTQLQTKSESSFRRIEQGVVSIKKPTKVQTAWMIYWDWLHEAGTGISASSDYTRQRFSDLMDIINGMEMAERDELFQMIFKPWSSKRQKT